MEIFYQQLTNLKAYRKDREELAQCVLDNPNYFKELLGICFKFDDAISYKAAWILEIVCLKNIEKIIPHLEKFLNELPKVYKHQSVRPMAKICEILLTDFYSENKIKTIPLQLQKKQRNQLTEICFDWLITDQKVACKAYAMQCLYLLGKEIHWVHSDLKILLLKDFAAQQPAFKARARHILKKLEHI